MGSAPVYSNPISPSLEAAVRQALTELLASQEFRSSRKSQLFLKYAVEETLAGRQESLKERVIGSEVFGRSPGFETAGDSIVRVKATEVRRRLARYYQEHPGPGLRIELPTGSYVPQFHFVEADVLPPPSSSEIEPARYRPSRRSVVLSGVGGLSAVAAWRFWPRVTPMEQFWKPLLSAASPIVVCTSGGPAISARRASLIETLRRPQAPGAMISLEELSLSRQAQTSWPTVQAIVDISRILSVEGKEFQVRVADEMSFEQIRNQPIVVIGMFSNPWTIELTRQLRFTFEPDPAGDYLVRDAQHPEAVRRVVGLYPTSPMPVDYALVTRLLDPQQDRRVVAIGGISGLGTRVAANFAATPRNWEQFATLASPGWEDRNLQVLLETRIVGDTPSPPTIIGYHVW